jgi:hypothetical protein
MKPITSFALLAAIAATIGAANAAATDPVGYTTTTIYGAFGPGSPKNNVIAPDLENPATWAGTVSSVTGDQVVLTGAAFTAGAYNSSSFTFGTAYNYFIETADGYWAHVVSNDGTSVTVEAGAGVNFAVGEAVTIHKNVTIAQYFGANNETGLLGDSVNYDPAAADNIVLIDEVNGTTVTVFANNINGGTWTTGDYDEAANLPIYPDQAVQVLRRGTGNLNLVLSGQVDVNGRQVGVSSGAQVRPYATPVDITLNDLNLYTGNVATGVAGTDSGDAGQADVVSVIVNGVVNQYVYSTIDLGSGVGWYTADFSAPAPVLPAGAGLIVNRTNPTNNSPFVWALPAVEVAN